jgi:orotidine-5'-phosphate decarboxylase
MTRTELFKNIRDKKSFLCIGLDTDLHKIPRHLLKEDDPVFEFNRQIVEATHDLCVAYKPNLAFYESLGPKGLTSLEKTLRILPKGLFTIADAKRGDIGNTSGMYARAFFEHYGFDSVTVAPYMGSDSVKPFLAYPGKWVILLALTSNEGSSDFQLTERQVKGGKRHLFEDVLDTSSRWGSADNMMYVVGATHPQAFQQVRAIVPDHFLLVPGVGAQGGDLEAIALHGMNSQCGLLVNASRQVLYASSGEDFAEAARAEAMKLQRHMELLLETVSP